MGNHLFVIFAVLDVSLAVNWCINCSYFLHIFLHNVEGVAHCPFQSMPLYLRTPDTKLYKTKSEVN